MKRTYRIFYSIRTVIFFAALAYLCIATTSCSQPKALTVEKVGNVRISPTGQPPFLVDVQFYNPNGYAIELKHADVEIYVNNTHLGQMRLDTTIKAPAHASFQLPVGVKVDVASILPNIGELLFAEKVHVKLDGSIKAGRKGIFINIPLHYEGDQVPDRLQMKLMNGFK